MKIVLYISNFNKIAYRCFKHKDNWGQTTRCISNKTTVELDKSSPDRDNQRVQVKAKEIYGVPKNKILDE